ncbi:MAG: tail fiber protein [Pseudomonadota bacterium]
MSQPYVGEIRMFGGNFNPAGWAFCNGQLLPISENETLFQLIGTTYGGNGQSTFGLPNLQGRVPVHMGTGSSGITYQIGEVAGVESVTLTTQQIPQHTHAMLVSSNTATSQSPTNSIIGKSAQIDAFINSVPDTPLNANSVTPRGGSQPHENMQPYLCINFIISLFGIFPTPT